MDRLTFDPETHTYRLDGVVLPSVTQILAPLIDYSRVPAGVLELARERGQIVHEMIALDAEGSLEEFDPSLEGYLNAYKAWVRDSGFVPVEIEKPRVNLTMKYAGTPDLIGWLGEDLGLVDAKTTSALMDPVGPQTAAYAAMWNQDNPDLPIKRRIALLLQPTGAYKAIDLKCAHDLQCFNACLVINRWRQHPDHKGNGG